MLTRIDQFIDDHRADIYPVLLVGILVLWISILSKASPDSSRTSTEPVEPSWRLTTSGWELAHALPSPTKDGTVMDFPTRADNVPRLTFWIRIHRCVLPVAVACLFATLMPWLLLHLPNRSVSSVST